MRPPTTPRQIGLGWGKGRPHLIKTIIRDDALSRALERQRRWAKAHGVEDAAPVVDPRTIVRLAVERTRLRMAKAPLRPTTA